MEPSRDVKVSVSNPIGVIHCSDGIAEETEENIEQFLEQPPTDPSETVDPSQLSWGPWFYHQATSSTSKVLNAIDYAGEGLAHFFGITTPKYQLEIEEYERLQVEKKKKEEESVGWTPDHTNGDIPLVVPPKSQTTQPKDAV